VPARFVVVVALALGVMAGRGAAQNRVAPCLSVAHRAAPGTPVVVLPFERYRHNVVMPSERAVDRLRDAGVPLVVVRLSAYPPDRRGEAAASFASSRRVRLEASFGPDRPAPIPPPPRGGELLGARDAGRGTGSGSQ